jgi:Tfp pilus assembly protein PilX
MSARNRQSGMTLVVGLIMLAVLTLMVVSAIRFGNINLRIAGNAQTEAEASAATQVALEAMLKDAAAAENLSNLTNKTLTVSTGGTTYPVSVLKPVCILTKSIKNSQLDPTKSADRACFSSTTGGGADQMFTSGGGLTALPSACKDQQWDIAASVTDTATGATVSMLQGFAVRVGAEVQCP